MGEMNKITSGLDVKSKLRLSLMEQIILFITMRPGPSESNDEYLDNWNS